MLPITEYAKALKAQDVAAEVPTSHHMFQRSTATAVMPEQPAKATAVMPEQPAKATAEMLEQPAKATAAMPKQPAKGFAKGGPLARAAALRTTAAPSPPPPSMPSTAQEATALMMAHFEIDSIDEWIA
eukprot:3481212-Amphidinium_carterae.1